MAESETIKSAGRVFSSSREEARDFALDLLFSLGVAGKRLRSTLLNFTMKG